jgi:VWFA-related protein
MSKFLSLFLTVPLLLTSISAQQVQKPAQKQATDKDETIRISTSLVQTDVVVTDKNEQPIPNLKMSDFEVYENGKKQELKFIEYISADGGRRTDGNKAKGLGGLARVEDAPRDLSAADVKRVMAFVVDDLTIPFADMPIVRKMLTDFVDNQMQPGDLIAIVRTVGGKGLLQQFTGDRQLLRQSIASLTVTTNPLSQFNNPDFNADFMLSSAGKVPPQIGADNSPPPGPDSSSPSGQTINALNDNNAQFFRALIALQTTDYLVSSMKELPGRKSLVLVSGGMPLFESGNAGTTFSNVSSVLGQVSDNAVRAGVVINTMDPRGLNATPGVASFQDTPAKSALGVESMDFGKSSPDTFGAMLAGAGEHQGLRALSDTTGGVTVVNTNDFQKGLDKIVARSKGYYILAYTPMEAFDNKFRKLQIKVKVDNAHVYKHSGYLAREDTNTAPKTKEQLLMTAASSPLAKRDVDVASTVSYKISNEGKAAVDIDLLVDPTKLSFTTSPEGRQATSFDVVGFVYDQLGKLRGGFNETVNANLTPEDYARAKSEGLTYDAHTELPPGYYQLRIAVRDAVSGSLGTLSRYVEIPDLSKRRLAMSSLFLYGVDPVAGVKATPEAMSAARRIPRKKDLRYAAVVYNGKQPKAKIIISQNGKPLFEEPEQPLVAGTAGQMSKVGQVALAKVPPGRYVLTVVVTDSGADKKFSQASRSLDFVVTN